MIGFQAEGADPIMKGSHINNPKTIATAIRIGNPTSWEKAEQARDEYGGLIDVVSDRELLEAYKLLAFSEGVFCELASAASIAGVIKLNKKGYFEKDAIISCTITGHGLKDPGYAIKQCREPKIIPFGIDEEKLGEILFDYN